MTVEALSDALLHEGLDVLEEQRQAMLARDDARLEAANLRLAAWIEACRLPGPPKHAVRAAGFNCEAIGRLQTALGINAALARRGASHATRALGALVEATPQTYDGEGRAATTLPRRTSLSA